MQPFEIIVGMCYLSMEVVRRVLCPRRSFEDEFETRGIAAVFMRNARHVVAIHNGFHRPGYLQILGRTHVFGNALETLLELVQCRLAGYEVNFKCVPILVNLACVV